MIGSDFVKKLLKEAKQDVELEQYMNGLRPKELDTYLQCGKGDVLLTLNQHAKTFPCAGCVQEARKRLSDKCSKDGSHGLLGTILKYDNGVYRLQDQWRKSDAGVLKLFQAVDSYCLPDSGEAMKRSRHRCELHRRKVVLQTGYETAWKELPRAIQEEISCFDVTVFKEAVSSYLEDWQFCVDCGKNVREVMNAFIRQRQTESVCKCCAKTFCIQPKTSSLCLEKRTTEGTEKVFCNDVLGLINKAMEANERDEFAQCQGGNMERHAVNSTQAHHQMLLAIGELLLCRLKQRWTDHLRLNKSDLVILWVVFKTFRNSILEAAYKSFCDCDEVVAMFEREASESKKTKKKKKKKKCKKCNRNENKIPDSSNQASPDVSKLPVVEPNAVPFVADQMEEVCEAKEAEDWELTSEEIAISRDKINFLLSIKSMTQRRQELRSNFESLCVRGISLTRIG